MVEGVASCSRQNTDTKSSYTIQFNNPQQGLLFLKCWKRARREKAEKRDDGSLWLKRTIEAILGLGCTVVG